MQGTKAKIINSIVPNYSPRGSGMTDCLTPHTLLSFLGPNSILREKNFNIHLKIDLLKGNAPSRQHYWITPAIWSCTMMLPY